jgi:hypothetical protein
MYTGAFDWMYEVRGYRTIVYVPWLFLVHELVYKFCGFIGRDLMMGTDMEYAAHHRYQSTKTTILIIDYFQCTRARLTGCTRFGDTEQLYTYLGYAVLRTCFPTWACLQILWVYRAWSHDGYGYGVRSTSQNKPTEFVDKLMSGNTYVVRQL